MKILIENIEVTPGKSCFYASLKDLCIYNNIQISESELFFLCDSMYFEYDGIQKNQYTLHKEHTNDLFDPLRQYLNCKITDIDNKSAANKISWISKFLESDIPVMLYVDLKILNYHPKHYQLNNIGDTHCVLIYGINTEKNEAYICDSCIADDSGKVITYKGRFPLSQLIKNSIKYVVFEFQKPFKINGDIITECIIKNISNFLYKTNNSTSYQGNYALYKCIETAKKYTDENKEDYLEIILKISYFISVHYLIKFDYLIELYEKNNCYHTGKYSEFIQELKSIKVNWIYFSNRLFTLAHAQKINKINEVLDFGIEIVREQEKVFSQIINHLSSIKI